VADRSNNVHVELVRSGGYAGLNLVASVDTQHLPPDAASAVHDALDRVDLGSLSSPALPPGMPDRYQYDLTVTAGDRRHSLTFHEPGVPPELQPLVDALMPLASPTPPGP
jgi:hypothetical protein